MRKLIFDLDELDSTGKRSFVDTSMQSNDPMMDEAYGKAVSQQHFFCATPLIMLSHGLVILSINYQNLSHSITEREYEE